MNRKVKYLLKIAKRFRGMPWFESDHRAGTQPFAEDLKKRFEKDGLSVEVKQHPKGWWYVQ